MIQSLLKISKILWKCKRKQTLKTTQRKGKKSFLKKNKEKSPSKSLHVCFNCGSQDYFASNRLTLDKNKKVMCYPKGFLNHSFDDNKPLLNTNS